MVRPAAGMGRAAIACWRVAVPLALLILLVVFAWPATAARILSPGGRRRLRSFVRAPTGTRLEVTEGQIAEVEKFIKREARQGPRTDNQQHRRRGRLVGGLHAELGADGCRREGAAQAEDRKRTRPRITSNCCARGLATDPRFAGLEFAFNAGGMIAHGPERRPVHADQYPDHRQESRTRPARLPRTSARGRANRRRGRRSRHAAARLSRVRHRSRPGQGADGSGCTQEEIMKNVISAIKSSIQFNKKNFWFDPVSQNQYYVGVQYPEERHRVARDAAQRADHQPAAATAHPAEQRRHRSAARPSPPR